MYGDKMNNDTDEIFDVNVDSRKEVYGTYRQLNGKYNTYRKDLQSSIYVHGSVERGISNDTSSISDNNICRLFWDVSCTQTHISGDDGKRLQNLPSSSFGKEPLKWLLDRSIAWFGFFTSEFRARNIILEPQFYTLLCSNSKCISVTGFPPVWWGGLI